MEQGYVEQYGLHHWWLDCDEPCGGTNNGSYATDWLYNGGKWPSAFVGAAYPLMLDQTVFVSAAAVGEPRRSDGGLRWRASLNADIRRMTPPFFKGRHAERQVHG